MTSTSHTLNVQQFIDEQRFTPYQWRILISCFLLVAIDVYDAVAVGFVVPVLAQEWGVSKAAFGPVMSAAVFGLAIGALIAGPLFDRISPKTVIVWSMFMFGVCSIGTMTADSLTSLGIWRLLTGIGLGAALPGAATLMFEYAPARMNALLVNAIGCGALVGATACGLISAALVPTYGWESIFIIGGVFPIVLAVFMLLATPQPLRFMVQRGWPSDRIAAVLRRIAPGKSFDDTRFVLSEEPQTQQQTGVSVVLSKRFRAGTLMLWSSYFFAATAYYLMLGWMPTLIQGTGATLQQATLVTTLLAAGGIIGTFGLGWLMGRFDRDVVIAAAFALGGLGVWIAGHQAGNLAWLAACIFIAGIGISGAIGSMAFLAAAFYPTSGRSTGISWMQGMGRFGGIAGPIAGALMLKENFSFSTVFTIMMGVVLASAAALLVKRAVARHASVGVVQSESA
ncbi:MFS transporter [Noviherbaspirillum saxi]|uniref:MFS transporter n=1 Tax=Noviherbaspirillum saxi TaxID=2320863 RepID=A0A3A3FK43_9BURK|nr:MFS transporter [Noviherbaspirillum saxi]RJF91852.1 MFS transporter [Noviherbaspirillum saxi]